MTSIGRIAVMCIILLSAAIAFAEKDSLASPTDLQRVKVGDHAPDFTLEDENGNPVTLSKFQGDKVVVLVFYRGFW